MSRLFFIAAVLLLSVSYGYSKHIIGGEATYVCTSSDGFVGGKATFDFTFIIYRDKLGGGANYDSPGRFGIYRQIGNSSDWESIDSTQAIPQYIQDIQLTHDPCVIPPNNVAAEKGEYHFSLTLTILANESYQVAYQRCCRNNTINNIIRPDLTGAAYFVEISPESMISANSSPIFNDFPPLVICSGIEFDFDHSATDLEGDSLVYSYYNPLHAGGLRGSAPEYPGSPFACDGIMPSVWNCQPPYALVQFATPYSYDVPLGGAPIVGINRKTGLIKGTPNILGQFVVGVKVEEYRNGKLIGAIYRDFQFNVTPCDPKIYAEIDYDELLGQKKYVINSCGIETIDFINVSQDVNYIFNNIWTFDLNGTIDTIETWNAQVDFPGPGNYQGKLILNPGTQCIDSADIFVNVFPDLIGEFKFEYDTCVAGAVQFTDQTYTASGVIDKWIWDLEPDYRTFNQHPNHYYDTPGNKMVQLIVEDKNECIDTVQKEVPYFPAPAIIVVEPTQFKGCVPAILGFQNLSIPIDSSYTTIWSFGDGGISDELHPVHTYDQDGIFDIEIEVTSPIGCKIKRIFPGWITILEGLLADFYYQPDDPSILNNEIDFYDLSQKAISWQWRFGDGVVDFEQSPTHTYQDTGLYRVELLVTHENHCVDTLVQYIDIKPVVTYFMPNAFTPNGDGDNEIFIGSGSFTDGMKDFKLRIWSRWGNLIFESDDPEHGWNGRKNNVGEVLPQGVYIYQLDYVDARGREIHDKGFSTLVR